MASIPGKVFLLIGAAVLAVSYLIIDKNILFLLVGLIFFGYGLAKMLFLEKKEQAAPKQAAPKPAVHRTQHSQAQHHYKHCPYCRAVIHISYRFCHTCGARLR